MRAPSPSRLSLAAGFVVFATATATSLAQTPSTPSWGTTSESSEVISAWDMQPGDSNTTWLIDATGYRHLTSTGGLWAGVHVPNGAVIDYIELDACDTSATFEVAGALFKLVPGGVQSLAEATTGTTEADGCSRWRSDLSSAEIVDSQAFGYVAYVNNTGFDGTTTAGALRVYYHLQVSPAPAQATFGDVPTNHPFFQYVEALMASGITAGCGNSNFCPDAPLTRGQMAVFLAKALGLNWPTESTSSARQ